MTRANPWECGITIAVSFPQQSRNNYIKNGINKSVKLNYDSQINTDLTNIKQACIVNRMKYEGGQVGVNGTAGTSANLVHGALIT
ncbi:hypothetical protein ZMTM_12090 [Methyloradius palustris]|uniref:Uncharacterized protein n=1 Tax=Methyloradius palustris TaxID=2778876 RepID=A0A8D5G072_9PROT|nr:hypothetical protein ZMTM_12090 [Methyloradius palustris]